MKFLLSLTILFFTTVTWGTERTPWEEALRLKELDREADGQPVSNEIYPFITDGCSRFSDGYYGNKATWLVCCEIHDVAYWAGLGGNSARDQSDLELRECVSEKTNKVLGWIVWSGPRMATPINTGKKIPSQYRWGYGWPFVTGVDTKFNKKQKQSVIENIPSILPSIEAHRSAWQYPKLSEDDRRRIQTRILRLFDELGMDED